MKRSSSIQIFVFIFIFFLTTSSWGNPINFTAAKKAAKKLRKIGKEIPYAKCAIHRFNIWRLQKLCERPKFGKKYKEGCQKTRKEKAIPGKNCWTCKSLKKRLHASKKVLQYIPSNIGRRYLRCWNRGYKIRGRYLRETQKLRRKYRRKNCLSLQILMREEINAAIIKRETLKILKKNCKKK